MLPIIDYGSIAIVIPHVTAVGSYVDDEEKPGFEVFITGLPEPIVIGFESPDEANEAREELIALVAQFHFINTMGPDFEFPDDLDEPENDRNEH